MSYYFVDWEFVGFCSVLGVLRVRSFPWTYEAMIGGNRAAELIWLQWWVQWRVVLVA
jgi:hypothetical protein